MRKTPALALLLVAVVLMTWPVRGQEASEPEPEASPSTSLSGQTEINPTATDASLALEGQAALDRGMAWLAAQQNEAGFWSNEEFPALTGLALWALANGGYGDEESIGKAVAYILSCVHEDGSIYREPSEDRKGGGLANYNTAICMVALHALGRPEFNPVIQHARQFIAGTQHFGDDIYRGGMGYDPETGRSYADLSNSYMAFEAMRLTESVESLRSEQEKTPDLDWNAAIEFIERVQNRPESNDQPWASDDPEEKGGFVYRPDSSQAGSYTNAEGVVRLRSYGSMTYAGLLSFIYANVDRDDPRVQSALAWTLKFWNLEENPGMGAQGLYYYYNVLAKSLAVYGQDILELSDGSRINWRTELVKKLVGLQKIDPQGGGFWVNDQGRWWEADPVLVTSYTLLALEAALRP